MRKMIGSLSVLVLGLVLVAGCAKPPTVDIEAARSSIQEARSAGAGEYSPQSLSAAEDQLAALDAELKVQEEKFALFRKYDQAKTMAAGAQAAGKKAAEDAAAAKERARQEATQLLEENKVALEETREMMKKAPRGKGSMMDMAAMTADLDGVAASLTEIEGILASGRFLEAKTKAEAARATIEQVRGEITMAMEMKKGGR